jgi:hypothetical protein
MFAVSSASDLGRYLVASVLCTTIQKIAAGHLAAPSPMTENGAQNAGQAFSGLPLSFM